MTRGIFKSTWGHWVEGICMNRDEFYESESLVSPLKEVIIHVILSHYKEKYEMISTKEYLE